MSCVQKPEDRLQGTVLIVDDEPDDKRLTQSVVASVCPHLCIRSVSSGEELICYLNGENCFSNRNDFPYPILVLLDLRMPGMHGYEVLRWLRNHPPHNVLPVVVLTVSGEMLIMRYAYELGACSFLTKPIKAVEFKETMGKLPEWIKPMAPPPKRIPEQ
jgi:CheY-like chemotaxis protein